MKKPVTKIRPAALQIEKIICLLLNLASALPVKTGLVIDPPPDYFFRIYSLRQIESAL